MRIRILILLMLGVGATLQAQEPRKIIRREGNDVLPESGVSLEANYTVTVRGGLGEAKPADIVLSGNGPKFMAQLSDLYRKVELVLASKEGSLLVTYSITAKVPVKIGDVIQFADSAVTGNYLATLGEPFSILKVGDNALTIQIDKAGK